MSSSKVQVFNASISVTELLTKTLENVAKDLATRCIIECATRHGFDATTEIRELGLENLNLIKKQMSKKSSGSKKVAKEGKAPKAKKSSIPLPFIGSEVVENGCQGLAYNRGLFTQCPKNRMENGEFCSGCQQEADHNASGCPSCGTVQQRLSCGLYEFKDAKGRSPVSYVKLIEKLGITMEQVIATGKEIDEVHFEVVEKVSKAHRGRPKKAATSIVAEESSDLFQQLAPDVEEESLIMEEVAEKPEKVKKVSKKMSAEDKEAKKAALEQERETKKLEREAARLAEKEQKRLEKEAKIAEEKAAKEAKIAEEKAAKEAKIAEEKAAKEAKLAEEKAAKEAKRQQEKEAKELAKSTKNPVSKKVKEVTAEPVAVAAPVTPAPTKVTVTRITIGGIEYLKSPANILYDTKTKEEVGLYDPATKTIQPLPDEEEEEAESDYEDEEN
jgi:chemotaxis protein histidine kinase CheA